MSAFCMPSRLPNFASQRRLLNSTLCTCCVEKKHVASDALNSSSTGVYPRGKASSARRVFIGDAFLTPGSSIELPSSERAHLKASRASTKSHVTLLNSRGEWATGELDVTLSSVMVTSLPKRTASNLSVALCLPRRASRADWAVEKLVEVGASSIIFCAAERAQHIVPTQQRRERWMRLSAAAAKQCLAEIVTDVRIAYTVDEVIAIGEYSTVLLCSPLGKPLMQLALGECLKNALIIVGPEGGFTREEEDKLVLSGAKRVHLGERRLRVETAAVVSAGVVVMLRDLMRAERRQRRVNETQYDENSVMQAENG